MLKKSTINYYKAVDVYTKMNAITSTNQEAIKLMKIIFQPSQLNIPITYWEDFHRSLRRIPKRNRVLYLNALGLPYAQIARLTNISRPTVYTIVNKEPLPEPEFTKEEEQHLQAISDHIDKLQKALSTISVPNFI